MREIFERLSSLQEVGGKCGIPRTRSSRVRDLPTKIPTVTILATLSQWTRSVRPPSVAGQGHTAPPREGREMIWDSRPPAALVTAFSGTKMKGTLAPLARLLSWLRSQEEGLAPPPESAGTTVRHV